MRPRHASVRLVPPYQRSHIDNLDMKQTGIGGCPVPPSERPVPIVLVGGLGDWGCRGNCGIYVPNILRADKHKNPQALAKSTSKGILPTHSHRSIGTARSMQPDAATSPQDTARSGGGDRLLARNVASQKPSMIAQKAACCSHKLGQQSSRSLKPCACCASSHPSLSPPMSPSCSVNF